MITIQIDTVNAVPANVVIPIVLTMRQTRLILLQYGLLGIVDSAILNGTDEAMKIEWEYATEVRRDWSSLIALAAQLQVTSEQLDSMFLEGSLL